MGHESEGLLKFPKLVSRSHNPSGMMASSARILSMGGGIGAQQKAETRIVRAARNGRSVVDAVENVKECNWSKERKRPTPPKISAIGFRR